MKDKPLPAPSDLLKQFGLRANRRLGQNFLQDERSLETIAALAEIDDTDSVLEIGAGLGGLTRHLSTYAHEVVAVELDKNLERILLVVLKPYKNVRLVLGDILSLTPKELGLPPNYIVAANIPYNITSSLIRHLLESETKPRRMVLTLQEEVAERICNSPPDMNLLALSVQVYGRPIIAARIPAESFFPVPEINSAVIKIEIYPEPLIPHAALSTFFKLTRAGFGQKRKTLLNALSAGLHTTRSETTAFLNRANLDPNRRAETLSLEEWGYLINSFTNA